MKRIGYLLVFVFVMTGVFAVSGNLNGPEGVSPGSYSVNFKAGLKQDFVFDFVVDKEKELKVRGGLAEYVKLDKEKVLGNERVVVTLNLPENVSYFGVSNIWILAGSVAGIIKVKVPYPDKYVKLELAVPNVNVDEKIIANLKVSNFGKEALIVSPVVEVYSSPVGFSADGDSIGFEGNLIGTFKGDEKLLGVFGNEDYSFDLSSSKDVVDSDFFNYSAGEYFVVARVEEFEDRDTFRIGEFKLKILDYTREIDEGIGRFNIEVESFWDDDMKDVYAEVRVACRKSKVGGSDVCGGFDSSIVSLPAWGKKNLSGYFDSEGLEGGVAFNVDVHYFPLRDDSAYRDGAVESEVVTVNIRKSSSWIPWAGLVFVLIFLFWWLIERK